MSPIQIARRFLEVSPCIASDYDLLNRFISGADQDAFTKLVEKFGPLVLATCRRILGPSADAEDAFQAVFLTLAQRAASIRDPAALTAWLHRVALRVSHKVLARRRPLAALPDTVSASTDPFADVAWKEVRRILDEELDRLPEKQRGPVILCLVNGAEQDEAANRLGLSLNTLKRRLNAGRDLLRRRLLRRGVAPVLVAAAVLDPTGLRAAVPAALLAATVRLKNSKAAPHAVAALVAGP